MAKYAGPENIRLELHDRSLYRRWKHMYRRCYEPVNKSFRHYGAKGVVVCDGWKESFYSFASWALENGYKKELQIDRIDNGGPYSPENCRWVSPKENNRNRSNNNILQAFGERKSLSEWAEDTRTCVLRDTLKCRIARLGWSPEDALTTPSLRFSRRPIRQ